jgi:hypothetical protein
MRPSLQNPDTATARRVVAVAVRVTQAKERRASLRFLRIEIGLLMRRAGCALA